MQHWRNAIYLATLNTWPSLNLFFDSVGRLSIQGRPFLLIGPLLIWPPILVKTAVCFFHFGDTTVAIFTDSWKNAIGDTLSSCKIVSLGWWKLLWLLKNGIDYWDAKSKCSWNAALKMNYIKVNVPKMLLKTRTTTLDWMHLRAQM